MKGLFVFRRLTHVLLLLSVLIFTSCDYDDPEFTEVGNLRVENMAGQQLNARLSVTCDNPNSFGFKVKKGVLDVSVNDAVIGIINLEQKVKFKRKSKNVYDIPVSVQLAPGGLIRLMQLAGAKEVVIRFKGTIRGSVFGIGKSIPVDITRKIDGSMLKLKKE